jgi:glycosyltransferase involved in cell wall biosynthesis
MPPVKRILIDLEKLKNRYVGLGEVSSRFAKALQPHAKSLLEEGISIYLLVPSAYKNQFGKEFHYITTNFLNKRFPALLPEFDLWHAIHQTSSYVPYYSKTKYLLTIHDLNFIHEKQGNKVDKYKNGLQRKIDRTSAITTISDFTKKEVYQYLKVPDPSILTIRNGVADPMEIQPSRPAKLTSDQPFLFHLAAITRKKNTEALLDLMKTLPGKKLVMAGTWHSKYAKHILERIARENIENIITLNQPNESEKAWLYAHCEAFLFPSLFEGFGLPVIEAMYCGKPVFASRHSSLPEIGSDKVCYWDHFDPMYMKEMLLKGLNDYNRQPGRAAELRSYAASFSWEETILRYIALYKSLLKTAQ